MPKLEDVSAFYSGAKEVERIYSGSTEVWAGGPPRRTVAPTFREARPMTWSLNPETSVPFESSGLTGDRGVFLLSMTTVGGSLPTDVNISAIEGYDDTQVASSGHGSTFSHPYVLKAGRKTVLSDTEVVTLTHLPSSGAGNVTNSAIAVTFVGSSVNGTPTLVRLDEMDGVLASGFSLDSTTLTWPTVEVPAGYTAVYMMVLGGDYSPVTWATATERTDSTSFTGTDITNTAATLVGPHSGAGVTVAKTGLQTAISTRGIFTAIYLVPGT
jgi:hypothetical protein